MLDVRVALARALVPSLIALASCAATAPPPHAAADTVSVRISEMPLVFRITVAKDAVPGPTSGRLFVFMSPSADRKDPFETDQADPARVLVASKDVTHVLPGATLELDPSHGAFPDFGTVAPGSYAVTALLDVDHSLPHTGPAAGDVVGPVVKLDLDPGHTGMVDLRLHVPEHNVGRVEDAHHIMMHLVCDCIRNRPPDLHYALPDWVMRESYGLRVNRTA